MKIKLSHSQPIYKRLESSLEVQVPHIPFFGYRSWRYIRQLPSYYYKKLIDDVPSAIVLSERHSRQLRNHYYKLLTGEPSTDVLSEPVIEQDRQDILRTPEGVEIQSVGSVCYTHTNVPNPALFPLSVGLSVLVCFGTFSLSGVITSCEDDTALFEDRVYVLKLYNPLPWEWTEWRLHQLFCYVIDVFHFPPPFVTEIIPLSAYADLEGQGV